MIYFDNIHPDFEPVPVDPGSVTGICMRKNVLINVNVTAMRIDLKERFFRPLISDCSKTVAGIKSINTDIS